MFSCSIAAGVLIKRLLKNNSSWWLFLQGGLSQVYSKILSRYCDCYFREHIFDNYFLMCFMANIFVERIIHSGILYLSCFSKRLHVRFCKTQLNWNEVYWNIGDLTFLYRCSPVDLLHHLASSKTPLYMLFYSYIHILSFCSLQLSTVQTIELFLRYFSKVLERFAGHLFWIVLFKEYFKKSVGQNIERRE